MFPLLSSTVSGDRFDWALRTLYNGVSNARSLIYQGLKVRSVLMRFIYPLRLEQTVHLLRLTWEVLLVRPNSAFWVNYLDFFDIGILK